MRTRTNRPPNIVLLMVDELRLPQAGQGGMLPAIREIVGFEENVAPDNPFASFFPGLLALRRNAVVLRNHTIASSACTPSRSTLFTGQYGSRTGVTQTDGIFKSADDPAFPWLAPDGVPTLGDWFRAGGYTTHYFGKWHISHPENQSLQEWGFSDWELSYPEPHGTDPGNMGLYRDIGFADAATTFLRRKAAAVGSRGPQAPWLAVVSLVNPHDIAVYPLLWHVAMQAAGLGPMQIPPAGARSRPPPNGTLQVPLNPGGFPQACATAAATLHEQLSSKPRAQLDYAYKMGLALASKAPAPARPIGAMPWQLSRAPEEWFNAYIQFYTYLHYVVDMQLSRVVSCIHDSGLAENTIVMYTSDHGELGGAHGGMLEKWHCAYQEALHVPCVISSPLVNASDSISCRDGLTSHLDIVPTLLGLAGLDPRALLPSIQGHTAILPPGADLSGYVWGDSDRIVEPDGSERRSVLFVTDDSITEPVSAQGAQQDKQFSGYLREVRRAIAEGAPIAPGSVVQPAHVQAVRTQDWKLSRYWDPLGNAADEYELYYLARDTLEVHNLVRWQDGRPEVDAAAIPPEWGLTAGDVALRLKEMQALLLDSRVRLLGEHARSSDGEQKTS